LINLIPLKRWQISKLLQSLLLISFLNCLTSCSHGPKITLYTSDFADGGFATYDEITKVSGFTTYSASAGLVAYSELDAQSLLNACAQKLAKPVVVRCVSHPELNEFECDNATAIIYADSTNYIGMTATDEKTLFSYCKFE
jgi:hypothetical protein